MALNSLDIYNSTASYLGISTTLAIVLLTMVGIWSLVWKGFALWKSSKKNQLVWFIVLLVVNTAGILEILYIFIFSEMGRKNRHKNPVRKKR